MNSLSIGTVLSGNQANAQITGTAPNQVLNLILPKGDPGEDADYSAGAGISIQNGTITNTGDTDPSPKVRQQDSFGGDVSGTYDDLTVTHLYGRALSEASPQEGDILTFQSGKWVPAEPSAGSTFNVGAGAVGPSGTVLFTSPGINVTVVGANEIRVARSGGSLTASNCSIVATARNGLNKFYHVTFSGGQASIRAFDNEAAFPMNFIIYY